MLYARSEWPAGQGSGLYTLYFILYTLYFSTNLAGADLAPPTLLYSTCVLTHLLTLTHSYSLSLTLVHSHSLALTCTLGLILYTLYFILYLQALRELLGSPDAAVALQALLTFLPSARSLVPLYLILDT